MQPTQLQRKVFAECFYVMALSQYALAIKSEYEHAWKSFAHVSSQPALSATLFAEATEVFDAVLRFSAVGYAIAPAHVGRI